MTNRGSELAALLGSKPEEATISPKDIAQALIHREKALTSLISYAQFIDPNYRPYKVHYHIAAKLELVEQGKIRRLAIFVPPAIGKSRLASEIFPSWFFGRNPTLEYIQTSYDADLAFGFGRIVRNLIMEPRYRILFPDVSIADDAKAMDEWHTTQKGEYKAEGVGGGLVGFHANILNIDDPFKSYEAAASPNERRKIWDWYTATVLNRLRSYKEGTGAIICIMQRWHDDDLGGRIEKLHDNGEEEWDIVRIPSIAEEEDPLGRAVGECLLPEGPNQRTVAELDVLKSHNPPRFMALHQQKPVGDTGEIFDVSWIKLYDPRDLPKGMSIYLTSDYAYSDGVGDYTIHIVFGVDSMGHVWIIALYRKQVEIMDGVDKAIDFMLEYKPFKGFIERVAMTKIVGPVLKKRMGERKAYMMIESVSIPHQGGKDSDMRAGSIAGAMQMGYVHVPEHASWRGDFEYELSRFPNGKFDDQVDAISLIGMSLAKLTGSDTKKPVPTGPPKIEPVNYTFDQILNRAAKRRRGYRVRSESAVVAWNQSVLDEAA